MVNCAYQRGANVDVPAFDEEVGDIDFPYHDYNVDLHCPLYTNSTCTFLMVVILITTFVTKYSLTKLSKNTCPEISGHAVAR